MASILPISIDDLLYRRGIESTRVELKATWDFDEKSKMCPIGDAIVRTICAFANDLQNLNGGYVILGVEEAGGVASLPPRGLTPEALGQAHKRLREWSSRIEPHYLPVFSPEKVGDRLVLVIWAPGGQDRPYQAPESNAKGAPRRFYVRHGEETIDAGRKPELMRQLTQLAARIPFDDRRAVGAKLEDIRETKVREFLHDVGSSLVDEPDVRAVYRQLLISEKVNSHEEPRNVGLLFFSQDPRQWFPGARIEIAEFAGHSSGSVIEERVFDQKPLHEQLRDCLSYLENLSVRQITKLPRSSTSSHWVSYPQAAMREALVNAVYHRSYERDCSEAMRIGLYPDRMEITSYPGPVPGIEKHHLDGSTPLPQVPARNRRIGEFLKMLKLAERWGTGLPKVRHAMKQNGSPPPIFDFDSARTYFRVTLPVHPEYEAILAMQDVAHLRAIGELREAFERIVDAFSRSPGNLGIALELAKAEILRDNLPGAIEVYERYRAANPAQGPAALLNLLAGAYLDRDQVQQAKEWMDRLGSLDSVEDAFDAAIHEHRAGRYTKAHEFFHATGDAVRRDPKALHEFAQVKIKLAETNLRGGKRSSQRSAAVRLFQEAREMLERVVQMDAPPTRRAWAWFNLAKVLRQLGAPLTEARTALGNALAILPGEDRFHRALADLDG